MRRIGRQRGQVTGVLDLHSSSTWFESHSDRSQDLFLGHPKVKSPAMFEPNWLLSARPAGFLNLFLFYLEFLFLVILLFEWSACRQYVA